ncbi:C2 calcium-dependent domain-containing protein 4C [Acanthochromis polyacanthus]|uniref:C2 calcium-dependent domain-containing protein 4C n=1 Tax=Acanthochromis polyacanthus TaxID=80966 RepID=UPI0022344FD5|nr:C2 calcium-dependent domain-containing protein 4C [Acanthochromis polyacanthus]
MQVCLQRRTHHNLTGKTFGFGGKEFTLNHQKITMWVLGKIRESMESIPLELSRYIGKSEEDILLSSKTSFPQNLHSNILTPDKIPEFCLPPRLCKRSLLPETEKIPSYLQDLKQLTKRISSPTHVKSKNGDESVALKKKQKPLPFSAEGYGLTGIYESLNTRRKESLFLSKCPVYMFDRSVPATAPKLAKETNPPQSSGFFPLFSCKSLSETWSTERETSSSSDSSPLSSLYSSKFSLYIASSRGRLKGAVSCPSLFDSKKDRGRQRKGLMSLTTSPSGPPTLENSSPVLLPLHVLQGQQRSQQEHVLPLQGRGRVHLFAEHTTFKDPQCSLSTVRVRVVSVEGVWDCADRQTLNCAVNLCLTPGKLQQQESTTIRNCRSPVFNEDFFFTELGHTDLQDLQLMLKVVDKPTAGKLRRGAVIGVVTKPLSQLLAFNKPVD